MAALSKLTDYDTPLSVLPIEQMGSAAYAAVAATSGKQTADLQAQKNLREAVDTVQQAEYIAAVMPDKTAAAALIEKAVKSAAPVVGAAYILGITKAADVIALGKAKTTAPPVKPVLIMTGGTGTTGNMTAFPVKAAPVDAAPVVAPAAAAKTSTPIYLALAVVGAKLLGFI